LHDRKRRRQGKNLLIKKQKQEGRLRCWEKKAEIRSELKYAIDNITNGTKWFVGRLAQIWAKQSGTNKILRLVIAL